MKGKNESVLVWPKEKICILQKPHRVSSQVNKCVCLFHELSRFASSSFITILNPRKDEKLKVNINELYF